MMGYHTTQMWDLWWGAAHLEGNRVLGEMGAAFVWLSRESFIRNVPPIPEVLVGYSSGGLRPQRVSTLCLRIVQQRWLLNVMRSSQRKGSFISNIILSAQKMIVWLLLASGCTTVMFVLAGLQKPLTCASLAPEISDKLQRWMKCVETISTDQ